MQLYEQTKQLVKEILSMLKEKNTISKSDVYIYALLNYGFSSKKVDKILELFIQQKIVKVTDQDFKYNQKADNLYSEIQKKQRIL